MCIRDSVESCFPYYNSSLYAVWRAARCQLDVCEVQPYWSHMCQSLDHMRRHNVCHRDLWLPIMLLNFKDNTVGVADFGLTRNCFPMEAPTTWQPTAPQRSADLWTLGVVIAALHVGQRLLTKAQDADQLQAYIDLLGPAENTWPTVTEMRL